MPEKHERADFAEKSRAKRNKDRHRSEKKHPPHSHTPKGKLKGSDPTLPLRERRSLLHLKDVSEFDDDLT